MRSICFLLLLCAGFAGQAQGLPSNEEFLNEVSSRIDDSVEAHYLVVGADTCRFEKFDYDEWVKYYLEETVPLTTLNELAYKVHVTKTPYYWQQDKLKHAVCITAKTADSLLALPSGSRVYSISRPYFTDDGQYAVMDMNVMYRPVPVYAFTLLFHRTPKGWQQIGMKQNAGPID
jgi:hypothetical protein